MSDDTSTDAATPAPVEETDALETGHAVYDLTALRFASGVYPSRAKATTALKAHGKLTSHDLEIRKV